MERLTAWHGICVDFGIIAVVVSVCRGVVVVIGVCLGVVVVNFCVCVAFGSGLLLMFGGGGWCPVYSIIVNNTVYLPCALCLPCVLCAPCLPCVLCLLCVVCLLRVLYVLCVLSVLHVLCVQYVLCVLCILYVLCVLVCYMYCVYTAHCGC